MGLPHALAACDDDAKLPAALSEAVARVHGSGGAAALGEMLANVKQKTKAPPLLTRPALLEAPPEACSSRARRTSTHSPCRSTLSSRLRRAPTRSFTSSTGSGGRASAPRPFAADARGCSCEQRLFTRSKREQALTADARRELAQTREEIAQAEAANEALSTHHADHEDCLSLLDLDAGALAGRVPQAEEGSRLADLECVGDIRTLLASLSSCSETRTAAIAEARALAERDDITAREI